MLEQESDDSSAKTEEPSQKKLEDAVEKGHLVTSREVNSFLMMLFLTMLIIFIIPYSMLSTATMLQSIITNAGDIPIDGSMVKVILTGVFSKILMYFSPILITVFVVALLSSYVQHGEFIFAPHQIQLQLSNISLTQGFKRLFSFKSIVEFVKSFFKILLIGITLYLVIANDIKGLRQYHTLSTQGILSQLHLMVNNVLIATSIIMFVIACADYVYQRFEHLKSLRMTKYEQKEEYKQLEGSIEIKNKLKKIRKERLKNQIKQAVPKATVVITNPEHYAIALYYDYQGSKAPIVVAKGLDLVAQYIKELAAQFDVPIVENPSLARMLYAQVKPEQEIPIEHYEAIAKIISYVMSLKKRKP